MKMDLEFINNKIDELKYQYLRYKTVIDSNIEEMYEH